MPGTMPTAGLPPGDFNPLASQSLSAAASQPLPLNGLIQPPGSGAAAGAYMPQFAFTHPDLLQKHPFLPYDFTHIQRNMSTTSSSMPSRTHSVSSGHTPSTPPIGTSSAGDHLSSSRLSPASSRPSSSSPPSSQHTSISIKINSSLELQSNHDQSSEDSDEEQIDVVKSAFVPILSRTTTAVQPADSTVDEHIGGQCESSSSPTIPHHHHHHQHLHHQQPHHHHHRSLPLPPPSSPSNPLLQKYDLKAPSSRKPLHETAPRSRSPAETKLKPVVVQKTVWRPY